MPDATITQAQLTRNQSNYEENEVKSSPCFLFIIEPFTKGHNKIKQ